MLSVVESKIDERLLSNNDNPFYLFDINDAREKVKYWKDKLPGVEPYFAVKCNKNREVMNAIDKLGLGFECASKGEVEKVLDLGIDPEKIIYSHTVKQLSHLQFCAEKGVQKMTFDSSAELLRIKEHHPNAEVFMRIRIDKTPNTCVADVKFGCDIESEAVELIKLCRELEMNLIGINFHIGSITEDYQIYERALSEVQKLFQMALSFGFYLNFVNIGGGFFGDCKERLDSYVAHINKGISQFPKSTMIVAEPGRYFVESAAVLATQIILKRTTVDGHTHYYINEGVFLSFLFNLVYGRTSPKFSIVRKASKNATSLVEKFSTVWGCSCHYIDKVIVKQNIPELEIGDWLIFHDMGSYTDCAATNFNGFAIGDTLVYDSTELH